MVHSCYQLDARAAAMRRQMHEQGLFEMICSADWASCWFLRCAAVCWHAVGTTTHSKHGTSRLQGNVLMSCLLGAQGKWRP